MTAIASVSNDRKRRERKSYES